MTPFGSRDNSAQQGDLFGHHGGAQEPQLLPHQELEVAFLERQKFALLASETGCGKTATYLHRVAEVLEAGGKVVITVPAALIGQTLDAIRFLQPELPAAYVVGQTKGGLPVGQRFYLVTHEMLRTLPPVLSNIRPDLVVVDEADKAATAGLDPKMRTKKAMQDLTSRAGYVISATATPVNGATGLDLLALCDVTQIPGRPHRNELLRRVRHLNVSTGKYGTKQVPYELEDAGSEMFRSLLAANSIRTTVDQIELAMPEIHRIEIDVPLLDHEIAAYQQASRRTGLAGHHQEVQFSRSVESLIPATVMYLTEGAGSAHEKTVVFTETFDLLDPLAATLAAAGVTVLNFTGKVSPKQRQELIRLHHEPGPTVLLGTAAIEKGLNLQNSSQVVTVQQTWSPSRQLQFEGRARRIGSPHATVTHAIIRPDVPLEYRRALALDRKEAIIRKLLAMIPLTHSAGNR